MYTVQINFKIKKQSEKALHLDLIHSLLGAWRMNGQILGREFPIAQIKETYSVFVLIPDQDSLSSRHNNKYVDNYLQSLDNDFFLPKISVLGIDPESPAICKCKSSNSYILFTTYISLESPLRCGECFDAIPLYKIPKDEEQEYHKIISWMSDYQSCDRLQMNCAVGERFSTNQLSKFDSPLTKIGLEICESIQELTGKRTYYYLYKGSAKSYKAEISRKCPCCNGNWYQDEKTHGIFNFKCEKCSLLSNIAWSYG